MLRRVLFALGTLSFVVLGFAACAPKVVEDPQAEQAAEDLAWLKENKPLLDEKRQELRQIHDILEGKAPAPAAEEGAAEGEAGEPPPSPEELEGRATALQAEIDKLSGQVGERVVSFLNNSNIQTNSAGIPIELTPDQRAAIDIKIQEDINVAQEYIDKGGDYARALDIYANASKLDPDHEGLVAAIAEAEEMRWMTEERFNQVKKKMTQEEVREILGTVMSSNKKEYPERGVVAWFYKKEDGGAAGVYFKEKNKGRDNWLVYNTDFNAIEQKVVGGD